MPIYPNGKTKDGKKGYRVYINYKDGNGNYKSKSKVVYGSPEAKLAEQQLYAELDELTSTVELTLQELYEKYIEYKKSEVRMTSLSKTMQILKNNVLPQLGSKKITKLNADMLQKWKNELNETVLALKTKRNIYGEFRAMLNYAVKMDYIVKNPLDKIGNFKEVYFEKPQDKLHYYTPEQFKKYINTAKETMTNPSDRACYIFFNIAYFTGMRKGEINALKWSDIEGDIIHVRRSVAQKVKGHSIVETPPKNKSSYRDIQMPKKLMDILAEHREYQASAESFSEDFRVCGGPQCISDTSINNHNRDYANAAELPHIRVHDFRHSHASLLANEGINIQEIARRLGHAKIEMTLNTYAHLYPREEERAVKVLDNI